MVKDFQNRASQLNEEKLSNVQLEKYQSLSNELANIYKATLKNIPDKKDLNTLNRLVSNYIDSLNKQIEYVSGLSKQNKSFLKCIESELIQYRSRIQLIYIKDTEFETLKIRLEQLITPSVRISDKFHILPNVPYKNEETGKIAFAPTISISQLVRFNFHDVEINNDFRDRELRSDYIKFLFYILEYLKLHIRYVFEKPRYTEPKKRIDYSFTLYLLNMVSSHLKNKKEDNNDYHIEYGDEGMENDNNKRLQMRSELLENFEFHLHEPLTSEISMIEQLREYLVVNQKILLKSKSTFIKEKSFSITDKFKKENKNFSLLRCLNHLKKEGYISSEATIEDFQAIFSGDKIHNKVEWKQTYTSLKYFINYLIKPKKIINPPPRKQKWEITSNCFLLVRDGIEYSYLKFKNLKKPLDKDKDVIHAAIREIY